MNKPFYGVATMPQSDRSNIVNNCVVPGPGTYDNNQQKDRNELPKWSLRKQLSHGSCFEKLSKTPGPGIYKFDEGFKKSPQKIVSSKGDKYRHYIEKSFSHSPLNIPSSFNLKGSYSFGYRQSLKEIQKSPGPIYHLDKILEMKRSKKVQNSHKGFGFGQKNNIYKANDKSPGPGSFDIDQYRLRRNKNCQKWIFGTAKRGDSLASNQLGPGEYDIKTQSILSRSFKIKGKNEPKVVKQSSLGPGSYDLPDTKTKLGVKFNIKKSEQSSLLSQQEKSQTALSPFTYNPPRYLQKPEKNGYSLGKRFQSSLDRQKKSHPGPGTYQIYKNQPPNQGGYMGRKTDQKQKEYSTADNFYKYDPKLNSVARQSPKFTFSQSGRHDIKQNNPTEGPLQMFYQTLQTKKGGYSYSIGTAKRFGEIRKSSGPFKQSQFLYSTIGQLPSYLKKGQNKK